MCMCVSRIMGGRCCKQMSRSRGFEAEGSSDPQMLLQSWPPNEGVNATSESSEH